MAKQHGLHEKEFGLTFIQTYSTKLTKVQKKALNDLKIETCGPFIAKIKDYQRINLQFLHTTKTQNVKSFQYVSRTGDSGYKQDPLAAKPPNHDYSNQPGSRSHWAGGRGNGNREDRRNVVIECGNCNKKAPNLTMSRLRES